MTRRRPDAGGRARGRRASRSRSATVVAVARPASTRRGDRALVTARRRAPRLGRRRVLGADRRPRGAARARRRRAAARADRPARRPRATRPTTSSWRRARARPRGRSRCWSSRSCPCRCSPCSATARRRATLARAGGDDRLAGRARACATAPTRSSSRRWATATRTRSRRRSPAAPATSGSSRARAGPASVLDGLRGRGRRRGGARARAQPRRPRPRPVEPAGDRGRDPRRARRVAASRLAPRRTAVAEAVDPVCGMTVALGDVGRDRGPRRGRRTRSAARTAGTASRPSRPATCRRPSEREEVALRRIAVTVNGIRHEQEVEPRQLLVYFLREQLGLTGTNVGCDTSSCGACTVLLDGESVKSCTVLAVQADGAEVTTIEGLATNGELHPVQRAFHEEHALQCGYCTPGMVLATVGMLAENPSPSEEEIRDAARGQPLPLHRLPQHRQGGPGRRDRVEEGRWPSPRERALHRHPGPAQGGPGAAHRPGALRRQPHAPGHGLGLPSSAARTRTRASRGVDVSKALEAEGVVAAYSGADLQTSGAARCRWRWPVTEDTKNPTHWPLDAGRGALRGRRRRRRRRADAGAREGRRRARRGRLRAAARGHRRDAPRSRTARRSSTRSSARTTATRGRCRPARRRPAVRRGRGHGEGALPPAAARPERDRAARRRSSSRSPAQGEYTMWSVDADPAHPPRHARGCVPGSRRRSCA